MLCTGVVATGAHKASALQNFRKPFHYRSFKERLTLLRCLFQAIAYQTCQGLDLL
jgi:hypothetical protein